MLSLDKQQQSSSRDERIAHRQTRIAAYVKQVQQKHEDTENQHTASTNDTSNQNNVYDNNSAPSSSINAISDTQCIDSRHVIQRCIRDCVEKLHEHIARFELLESDRRASTVTTADTINQLIESVTNECEELNQQLCGTWSTVTESTQQQPQSPNELNDKLHQQLNDARTVLSKKHSIINTLQQHIDTLNQQYIDAIAQQRTDIDTAIEIVDTAYDNVLNQSRVELKQCEDVYSDHRAHLLSTHNAELSGIYDKRRALELSIHSTVQKQEQQYSLSLELIRQTDVNDYATLKHELESNIELFQLQLESMKSIYALNTDKLLYNYTILQQKDLDNKQIVDVTRNKLRKLKDQYNTLSQRYMTLYNTFKSDNVAYSAEYTRLINTYKHLQNKYIYFQTSSQLKYHEVWHHAEQENLQLIHQLLHADQLITQNILNQKYTAPVLYHNNTNNQSDHDSTAIDIDSITIDMLTNSIARIQPFAFTDTINEIQNTDQQSVHTGNYQKSCTAAQQRQIVDSLVQDATYLLPNNTLSIQSTTDTSTLQVADQILSSLGVQDIDDYNTLISMFVTDTGELIELSHSNITTIIQQFVQSSTSAHSQTSTHLLNTRINNEKQQKQSKRIQQYWTDLRAVIQPKSSEMWRVLEQRLMKYNSILQQRQQLINETSAIAKQNAELKNLMQSYVA